MQHGVMANMTFDRDTLRALAGEGNQTALDRLADLADARGDLDELNERWRKAPAAPATCSPGAR